VRRLDHAKEPGDRFARRGDLLRERDGNDEGNLLLVDVVADRECDGAVHGADQEIHAIALDQLARLRDAHVRLELVVFLDELDLASAGFAADLREVKLESPRRVLAYGGDRAGVRKEQADLDRKLLAKPDR